MNEELLTKEEKRYLKTVIKPFRKNISCIRLDEFDDCDHSELIIDIAYYFDEEDLDYSIKIPLLVNKLMFQNLEYGAIYSLKELGI